MIFKKAQFYKVSMILPLLLLISACSNTSSNPSNTLAVDSFERFNRNVFSFNSGVDKVLLKPIAKAYKAIIPEPINNNIGNFISNFDDVGNAINNTLQGKFVDAGGDLQRIVLNSTLGFAGIVDIASEIGIQKNDEDFGQTLAKWGVQSGPYVMLPFLGPSTIRDGVAKLSVDRVTDPVNYTDASLAVTVVDTVKKRSDFFAQEEIVRGLSDDLYSALRDVWIENRKFLIRDGVADESADSDLIDELESLDAE